MSGSNHTTITQKLQNWAENNPSDLIFVLCVGGVILVLLGSVLSICLCLMARKTVVYEKIVYRIDTLPVNENLTAIVNCKPL